MNLANWLHQTGLVRPQAPALRSGAVLHATYAQFALRSWAIGAWLEKQHGITKGDRVAIFAKNCPEYLEVLYAVLWVGAAVVPVNYKLHPLEAGWIIRNAEAKLVITDTGAVFKKGDLPDYCPEVAITGAGVAQAIAAARHEVYRAPVPVEDADLAWLFYTSGTTGRPKGVILTHRNLRMMATSYALDVDVVLPRDHSLYAAPMSHGAGLYNFHFVRAGACHVIPESRGFDPAEIRTLGEALGDLVFFAAPTMVKRLVSHALQAGYGGHGIRTIIYGGGPMYAADLDEARRVLGPMFAQIYGQGESPMTITAMSRQMVGADDHPNAASRRASVGIAQSCVEVRVVNAQMQAVPTGEVGEVVVRGDTVMAGYWRNAEATAAAIVDGWLKTGDLGRFDADGFLTLTDRSKDVIVSGGTNIYPREVEEALLSHPQVFEVSVIGHPHPEWGEEVVAFIVLTGQDLSTTDLDDWCKAQIASFKKPKRYIFVPELPKNSYGKVLKTSLRERLAEGGPASAGTGWGRP